MRIYKYANSQSVDCDEIRILASYDTCLGQFPLQDDKTGGGDDPEEDTRAEE